LIRFAFVFLLIELYFFKTIFQVTTALFIITLLNASKEFNHFKPQFSDKNVTMSKRIIRMCLLRCRLESVDCCARADRSFNLAGGRLLRASVVNEFHKHFISPGI